MTDRATGKHVARRGFLASLAALALALFGRAGHKGRGRPIQAANQTPNHSAIQEPPEKRRTPWIGHY